MASEELPLELEQTNTFSIGEKMRSSWLGRNVVMPAIEGGHGDRIADSMAGFIQTSLDNIGEGKEALGHDFALINKDPSKAERYKRRGALTTGIGAFAVNCTQARLIFTTMLQAEIMKSSPFLATLALAGIHFPYYVAYTNGLSLGLRQAPETAAFGGRLFGIDKDKQLNILARMARGESFDEEKNPVKRLLMKGRHRGQRATATQIGGSTVLLAISMEAQGQSPKEQAKRGIEIAADNTVGSLGKGVLLAAGVTLLSVFDSGAANDVLNFSRTPEGAMTATGVLMGGFFGLGRLGKGIKKLVKRQPIPEANIEAGDELSPADYAPANNPLTVVQYG